MSLTRNALWRRKLVWAGLALAGLGIVAATAVLVTLHAGGKFFKAPAKVAAENTAGTPAEEAGKTANEPPKGQATEKPAVKAVEKPVEKPVAKPKEMPGEKPVEKPLEKPGQKPAESPPGQSAEKATDQPASEQPFTGRPSRLSLRESGATFAERKATFQAGTESPELRRKAAAAKLRLKPEETADRQLEHWEELGRTVLQTGGEAEFQQYQKARLAAPAGGGPISASLFNEVLRLLFAERRWDELERFEKQSGPPSALRLPGNGNGNRFKRQQDKMAGHGPDDRRLLTWMYERTVGRPVEESAPFADLSQPLIVPVSRGASGLFQQMRAALEDKQYEEAARLLTGGYALRDDGLIATPGDDQLFVSYRSMQLILLRRRELAAAMGGQLDAAAQLSIRQTLSQGDPAAVEALTVQYYGTPAHASACQWMGDRALAGADFTQALSWYEEGRLTASPEQQPDLAARVRLASAMLGSLRGEPPAQPVAFGESRISPEQFESRVRAAVARGAKAETASPADAFAVLPAPRPVQFRLTPWGEFDESGTGNGNPLSRRIAAVARDDLVLVSSRLRTVALDSADGKTRWSWELGNSGLSDPVLPLAQGRRIYLRTTMVSGRYGIVCLDERTGRMLWRRDCGDNAAGDPQLIQGRLYVLTLGVPTGSGRAFSSPLYLVELNPENGEVLSRRRCAEASVGGDRRPGGEVEKPPEYQSICVGNRLVVLYSGAVLCLDLQGRVQWLRNSSAIPARIDPASHSRPGQPPLESGGRLYLQQAGSCAVECLTAQTGELVWRRGVVGLQQILDLHDDRLLVRSTYGLTALRAATGEVLWRRELPGMLEAFARNTAGLIFCARRIEKGGGTQSALLWIDAATGKTQAHSIEPFTNRGAGRLGPIVASGDRAWCCQGGGMEGKPKSGNGTRVSTMEPGEPALEGDLP